MSKYILTPFLLFFLFISFGYTVYGSTGTVEESEELKNAKLEVEKMKEQAEQKRFEESKEQEINKLKEEIQNAQNDPVKKSRLESQLAEKNLEQFMQDNKYKKELEKFIKDNKEEIDNIKKWENEEKEIKQKIEALNKEIKENEALDQSDPSVQKVLEDQNEQLNKLKAQEKRLDEQLKKYKGISKELARKENALQKEQKKFENLNHKAQENFKKERTADCESGSRAGKCIDESSFMIGVGDIAPGNEKNVVGEGKTVKERVNFFLATIIQKGMIALGILALLIMTIGAGYMILAHGQDELLSKGKSIFISGVMALIVALSSYYLISFIRYILYAVNS